MFGTRQNQKSQKSQGARGLSTQERKQQNSTMKENTNAKVVRFQENLRHKAEVPI